MTVDDAKEAVFTSNKFLTQKAEIEETLQKLYDVIHSNAFDGRTEINVDLTKLYAADEFKKSASGLNATLFRNIIETALKRDGFTTGNSAGYLVVSWPVNYDDYLSDED